MEHYIQQADNAKIKNVTYFGVVVNVVLAIAKAVVGTLSGSMSLIADAIHSVSDMVTDVAVLLGVHYASKKPDPKHPYGHGRVETFSALFIAITLVLVGAFMIQQAAMAIARTNPANEVCQEIGVSVLWVALASIALKEFLYRITRRVAVKTHSTSLYANAWHHRSDALSSIAVFAGVLAERNGYVHGDQLAAMAVGLLIILVSIKIITGCFDEFAERSADAATVQQIESIIESEQRIRQWHNLRTRNLGREIFLDMHILVDPELNITDAHEIAESLESLIHAQLTRPVNITIHIEPDMPELRK